MELITHIASLFLSFIGFAVAFHIYEKKRVKKPLICPLRSNCDAVVTSNYSSFLGVPLERLGMAYYALIAVLHAVGAAFHISDGIFTIILILLSGGAFLFSLYLISIQAFVLKQWCVWCLTSASISTVIFFITILTLSGNIGPVLFPYTRLLTVIHLFGVAIGVGGATITDLLFFKFLRDYKISEEEASVMRTISGAIWVGLGIIIISGFGLFSIKPEVLIVSPKFIVKIIAVGLLVVNGYLLNLIVQPKLIHISFGDPHDHKPGELVRLRRFAFAFGAISISSWYFIFVLGALRGITVSFLPLVLVYILILLVAVFGSQLFVWHLEKSAK